MMYELKEQDDKVKFESKFPSQDVDLIEAEEKCLQPLLEVKSEPEEMKVGFGEIELKEETTLLYRLMPFSKDQIQKMMYELKEQDDNVRFGSKFPSQDVDLIAAEETCLQPLLEVKSKPEEMKEDFGEIELKEDITPLYQLMPFAKDQIQVLDEIIKNEDSANEYDKIKFKDDQKFLSGMSENSRTHIYGPDVNVEPDRNYDVHVTNDRASCNAVKHTDICQVCGKSFNQRCSLKRHLLVHTGNRPFSCEECGKSFNRRCNLKRHLLVHTGNLPFSCEECGKYFNQRGHLKTHLLVHTGNRQFSCEESGKSFNRRGGLKTHLLVHTGNCAFSCEECGKSFNKKKTLDRHLLIHTGNRRFCCEECGKSFNHSCNLERHLLVHTGNRPFSCEECGKSFNQRGHLNTHLLVHTGNRPFSCEECGKSFNRKFNLKTHLLVHTGNL